MAQVSEYRPKLAYHVSYVGIRESDPGVVIGVSGFTPSLPDDLDWIIGHDEAKRSDAEIQDILSDRVLLLSAGKSEADKRPADRIGWSLQDFVSPAFRDLLEELEPGRHRYFEVRVRSHHPMQGRVDHGTYYWLRPLPVVDCVLFPQTRTVADWKGKAWSKETSRRLWGGGVSLTADPSTSTLQKSKGITSGGRCTVTRPLAILSTPSGPGPPPCLRNIANGA